MTRFFRATKRWRWKSGRLGALLLSVACEAEQDDRGDETSRLSDPQGHADLTPVVLPVVSPRSGSDSSLFLPAYDEMLSAQWLVNRHGGVQAHALEFDVQDSASSPEGAKQAAQWFLAAGHQVILSTTRSGQALAIADVTHGGSALFLDAFTNHATSASARWLRFAPPQRHLAQTLATMMQAQGHNRIVVLSVLPMDPVRARAQDAVPSLLVEHLLARKCAPDCLAIAVALPTVDSTSLEQRDQAVRAALAAQPDALYLEASDDDGLAYLQSAALSAFPGTLYLTPSLHAVLSTDPAVTNPSLISRLQSVQATVHPERAAYQAYRQAVLERHGEQGSTTFPCVFDLVVLSALAIDKIGTNDPQALAAAIIDYSAPPGMHVDAGSLDQARQAIQAGQDIDYEGGCGPLDLDANGQVMSSWVKVWQGTNAPQIVLASTSLQLPPKLGYDQLRYDQLRYDQLRSNSYPD